MIDHIRIRMCKLACVNSYHPATNSSRRVRDARKSASERVHCCFCSSPRQANSAILLNLDQKTSMRMQKIMNAIGPHSNEAIDFNFPFKVVRGMAVTKSFFRYRITFFRQTISRVKTLKNIYIPYLDLNSRSF